MGAHYDVVVLGGTLSATVAAALLSERRFHGLLIDQGELATTGGAMLPDMVFLDGHSAVMQFVHEELRVSERLSRQTSQAQPTLQIVFPDERLDLPSDRTQVLLELERTLGTQDAGAARTLLQRIDELEVETSRFLGDSAVLPPAGFFARRSAASTARRHATVSDTLDSQALFDSASPALKALMLASLPFVTHLDARSEADVHVLGFVRPLARLLRGLYEVKDGRSVRSVFEDHAKRGGFEVSRDAISRVDVQGKLLEINVAEKREPITTSVLIDASSDLSGLDTFPIKRRQKLAATLEAARPKGYLHALVLEVDRDVVPPSMAENVILLNGRLQIRDENSTEPEDRPILLLRRPTADPKRVRLLAMHPLSSTESHADAAGHLDEVIRARVTRLIPFLKDGNPKLDSPSSHGLKRGTVPFLEHPLFDLELDPTLGIGGVPTTTPLKNVLVAGPAVLPGLGAEGQYLAALQAADEVERIVRGTKIPKTLGKRLLTAG